MSGQVGYRAIGDFIKRNTRQIISTSKPLKNRLPTFYTVRRVMQGLEFRQISKAFSAWAGQYVPLSEGEWISADGKAINGTISNAHATSQQFQSLVSLYCSKQQLSLANGSVDSSKQSESIVFRELLSALDLKDITITLDALHCQKKQQQQ